MVHSGLAFLRAAMEAPSCLPALCTNKWKLGVLSASLTLPVFEASISSRLRGNHLKPGFHLITLSHNFANCLFIGEAECKTAGALGFWVGSSHLLLVSG